MRISDWSSDVCSSDLLGLEPGRRRARWLHDHVGSVYRGRHGQGRHGDRVAFGELSVAKPECRGAGGRRSHNGQLRIWQRLAYESADQHAKPRPIFYDTEIQYQRPPDPEAIERRRVPPPKRKTHVRPKKKPRHY